MYDTCLAQIFFLNCKSLIITFNELSPFYIVTKCGAENRTASVDMRVKVTQIHRHRRSITMAANRHSPRTTTSSSSLLLREVIFLSSLRIHIRSDRVLWNGDSPGFGRVPFSTRMSSSSADKRQLDCRSCTTMSCRRVRSMASFGCLMWVGPGRFIHSNQARRPLIHSLT